MSLIFNMPRELCLNRQYLFVAKRRGVAVAGAE